MQIISNIQETKALIKKWQRYGSRVGFVPTMGYLHEGHQSLIEASIKENDKTVVSIFVNPLQFGPKEDLANYPRDLQGDSDLCESLGVDLIFIPSAQEIYVKDFCTYVDMENITNELCGKSRPGHFRGVCTVVNKLFNIITPDRAYFGQKDAQQLAVVKRMVRDLNMDVEVIGCPIVREADGLAKSSRNAYLNPQERKAALILSKAIFEGERLIKEGERNVWIVIKAMQDIIATEPMAKIDYIEMVDNNSIESINFIEDTVLVAMAVYIGNTRLIDNFICEV